MRSARFMPVGGPSVYRSLASRLGIGRLAVALSLLAFGFANSLQAQTIEPITWNVIGLDSNKPADAQLPPGIYPPKSYPVGVKVCNTSGSSADLYTRFEFTDNASPTYLTLIGDDAEGDTDISVGNLGAGVCREVFYQIDIDQVNAAYDNREGYRIHLYNGNPASGGGLVTSTPDKREFWVEYLVSQNRNAILEFIVDGATVQPGESVEVFEGQTLDLTIKGKTATQGYEQIAAFMNLDPRYFEIQQISATYSASAGTDPNAFSRLYADGCGWVNDDDSPNYHNNGSCSSVGKYGGQVTKRYLVTVKPAIPDTYTGQTLIYDFSGSSYHYNSDFSTSTLEFIKVSPPSAIADLALTKAAYAKSGSNPNYSAPINEFPAAAPFFFVITVANNSSTDATDVVVTDQLTDAYTVQSNLENASQGSVSVSAGNLVTWTVGTLAANSSATLELGVNGQPTESGEYDNTACASSSSADLDTLNNCDTVMLTPESTYKTDLAISKSTPAAVYRVGDTVTFTLTVTNLDPASEYGTAPLKPPVPVAVSDLLPDEYDRSTLSCATPSSGSVTSCSTTTGNIVWGGFTLEGGASATLDISASVLGAEGSDTTSEPWLNAAEVTIGPGEDFEDTNIYNNMATASAEPALLFITKSFASSTVSQGQTVGFTITSRKEGADVSVGNITVADVLPAGLTLVGSLQEVGSEGFWDCSGVTSCTATDPATARSYPDITGTAYVEPDSPVGTDAAQNFASIENIETSTIRKQYDDDTGSLTINASSEPDPPLIGKTFTPTSATFASGAISELELTITNPNTGYDLTNVAVSDTLPTGMTVAGAATTTCTNGSVTAALNSGSVALSGASLVASGSCTVTVDVQVTGAGTYANTTGAVSGEAGGQILTGGTASATFTATAEPVSPNPPTIAKIFTPTSATFASGAISELELTITNPNTGYDLTNVAVSDTLPTGMTVAGAATTTCTNGSVTAALNSGSVALSGASLVASGSCTVTVDVQVTGAGTYANTTGAVSGEAGGQILTGGTASATFIANPPEVYSVQGLVFEEAADFNGLRDGAESGTNGGGLYACLNASPVKFAEVGANGQFSVADIEAGDYVVSLATTNTGASCPNPGQLNNGWLSTGESTNGASADGTADSVLSFSVTGNTSGLELGIVKASIFDPPFGIKTGLVLPDQPIIRWTMVWINDSPIVIENAEIIDEIREGTDYRADSLECIGRGSTTWQTCEYEAGSDRIRVVAAFGPEYGNPTDEASAENELIIRFEVDFNSEDPLDHYENQGTLTWEPETGEPKVVKTDDPGQPGVDDPTTVVPPNVRVLPLPVPTLPMVLLGALALLVGMLGRRALAT